MGARIEKKVDFREVYLHLSDFGTNEDFEAFLEQFGIVRDADNDYQFATLTVTNIRVSDEGYYL